MLEIKKNDTGIGIEAILSNVKGVIDLTDSSVTFFFRDQAVKPIIKDAVKGNVVVVFNKTQTVKSGVFNGEFKVMFKDGRIETFPSSGYIKIRIYEDLS